MIALFLICALATAPATRSAKPQAVDLAALHTQAYELLLKHDYPKAKTPLEKVYEKTPSASRSRALVLNHAILDVTQKTYVMRALKDLTEYLTKNRDPDEEATNILGGALNTAVAVNSKIKSGDLWQSAFREWDRRNYVLDHSRNGWRRWGTRWIDDAEYARIQEQIKSLKQVVLDQQEVANRAYDRAASVSQQYTNAVNAKEQARYLVQYLQWYNGTYNLPRQLNTNPSDPNYLQFQPSAAVNNYTNAYMEAQRLGPEMEAAIRELNIEQQKLADLQKKVIRPEWPTRFEPVDPNGPEAETPIDNGPAATSAPTETQSDVPGNPLLPPRENRPR
jgi:hypothetical protein